MMTYFLDTDFDSGDTYVSTRNSALKDTSHAERGDIHLLNEKLVVPRYRGLVSRPRLEELLRKSVAQFPATLISGRTGTGKTVVAATFARKTENVAWYSVESAEADWGLFAAYFAAAVLKASHSKLEPQSMFPDDMVPSQSSMATFLINVFAEAETVLVHEPLLIVLDGIHHLFDAPWFGEFFGLLLSSLPENTNLLLLCRSKPPNPLWRLRSKQQLNVIDERVLAFTLTETADLIAKRGFRRSEAERAHSATFGRISKLLQFEGQKRARART